MDDGHEGYLRQILEAYRKTPGTMGTVRRADRMLAMQLYQRGVSASVIENAFVLAAARRLMRPADAPSLAGASLGLHDGEHVAACIVQAIICDAVPWLRVIAINWNLQPDLCAVVESPASSPQLWVDLQGTDLAFVENHGLNLPAECSPD